MCSMGKGTVSFNYTETFDGEQLVSTAVEEIPKIFDVINKERLDVHLTYLWPYNWESSLYIEFDGVPSREMNTNDEEIFDEMLRTFLKTELPKLFGDSVTIVKALPVTQAISTENRNLRPENLALRRTEEITSNRILTYIKGRCGNTCPSVPGAEVIVELINSEVKRLVEDCKEISNEVGNSYFAATKNITAYPIQQQFIPSSPILQFGLNSPILPGWLFITLAFPFTAFSLLCWKFAISPREGRYSRISHKTKGKKSSFDDTVSSTVASTAISGPTDRSMTI
mmetsp:Transcript_26986/g.39467  ORF Transcript_26986/g.39467 Transcript_26986/m.39467 type:complete len:283 (-) Transcript_26986:70-918(-)